jgi:hypothetical protein
MVKLACGPRLLSGRAYHPRERFSLKQQRLKFFLRFSAGILQDQIADIVVGAVIAAVRDRLIDIGLSVGAD